MSNALKSMYGDGHANATRTKECVAMPGVRNQVVMTPQSIVDGLLKFWGSINYDAAYAPGSLIDAGRWTRTRGLIDPWPHQTYCNPPYGKCLPDPEGQAWQWIAEQVIRARSKEAGKKSVPKSWWPDGLPCNTVLLDAWMNHQLYHSEGESIMLVPARTHRKWMRHWLRHLTDAVFLDPITFHTWDQAAPFPLVLGYKGYLNRRIEFRKAFAHVGDPIW